MAQTITKDQVIQLQSICSGKFHNREERLEALSEISGFELKSVKDLNQVQAADLIYFFNTGKSPDNSSWAIFDKNNTKHRRILAICHTLGWVQEDKPHFVDLHRLGGWLKSNRSPVQKPLKQMTSPELSKIIKALESITQKQYK